MGSERATGSEVCVLALEQFVGHHGNMIGDNEDA